MKAAKPNRGRERCLLVALLFLVAFNYPLVLAFNRTALVFGIPLLVLHLLGGWLLFIVVAFFVARQLGKNGPADRSGGEGGQDRP